MLSELEGRELRTKIANSLNKRKPETTNQRIPKATDTPASLAAVEKEIVTIRTIRAEKVAVSEQMQTEDAHARP